MSPIEGTMEHVRSAIAGQVCAEHGEMVICVWDAKANMALAKCAHGEYPARLKPVPSQTTVAMRDPSAVVADVWGNCPVQDLGDGHKLAALELAALRAFALRYHLDADRGHVYVMYSRPYVGLDGYVFHAARSKRPYICGTRPLSLQEKKLYMIDPCDYSWIAEGELLDTGTKVTGLGIVHLAETTERSANNPNSFKSPVVAAHPQLQAQKRAEWQWYRRAFPIGDGGDLDPVPADPITDHEMADQARRIAGLDEAQQCHAGGE